MTDTMSQVREALREALLWLKSGVVFISSREKMHPDGQALYLDSIKKVEAALAALSHPAPDVPGAEEVEAIRKRNRRNLEGVTIDNPPPIEVTDVCDLLRLLDAARAELAAERAKVAERLEADMFWDYYDPEQPYYSVEELIQEREYEGEGIVQVQEAIRCPDAAYIYRIVDDPETDDREIVLERLSDADHAHYRAAMAVASGAREMWGVMVDRLAAQMFAENPAPVPERMHTCQWKNLDWHYRKHHRSLAHERLAAALKGSGHD